MTYNPTEFSIGLSLETLVLLSELSPVVIEPQSSFSRYSVEIETNDGGVAGQGWPVDEWHWGFIHVDQWQALRNYCGGKSSNVFMRTYNDFTEEWETYSAVMIWPGGPPNIQARKVIDFTLVFRKLVFQEEE